MDKTFIKALFILILPLFVITSTARAQTITVGAIDPGPYGRGSTITLPFHIDNTSGCIARNNTYKLILSDANGSFASPVVLSTKTGFYETFANGIIPANTPAGTGYKLKIQLSSPNISVISPAFTIQATDGVTAGVSSLTMSDDNPEVFGACVVDMAHPPPPYNFSNTSTAGATVTAVFFNEFTQTGAAPQSIPTSFSADFTNYTVIVKATKGGIVGTKSYTLINNTLYSAFGGAASTTVCLGDATPLTYTIPLGDDPTGKQQSFKYNYPGLIYNIKWGDGASSNITFCEITSAGGKVSHVYNQSSCGNQVGSQKNVFQVDFVPVNPYCKTSVTPFTGYAKVLTQPTNAFSDIKYGCTNSPVTFTNLSYPGQDPDNNDTECKNMDARYTWSVADEAGTVIYTSPAVKHVENFVYTFPTHGTYKVTLHLLNNNGLCGAVDVSHTICIQNPPQPNFTIPALYCLADGPLTPVNTSVVDEICNNNTTYNWVQVSGPAGGVNFTASAKTPSFIFSKIGVYQFRLDITTLSCGTITGPVKEVVVNETPTATLSPDADQCGKGVTLTFDPNATATSTQTKFTGTAQTLPTTYTWTVTSPDGGTSSFAAGSTANSQYPSITFNDYATYNISVTHTNNCGTVTKTQQLRFVVAPTVSAGPPQPNVCEGNIVTLTGSPGTGGQVTAVKWTSPTGGTFTNPNSPNTSYTPTQDDINNGQVMLTYTVTTSLASPCTQISSTVLITLIKKATVTSSGTEDVCSGSNFHYTITAADPATTFNWTTALTTGAATGFGATGSGNTINDLIINNTNTDAVVTYTITPTLNGCTGTPFSLKLTIHPLPVITAAPLDAEICSNQPANITLASNVGSTTYTWTSVASNGITGNTNSSAPASVAGIQDVLTNNSGTDGTVTYTIIPYNGTCQGPSKQVVVTVKPAPIPSVAGPDESICISSTYTLKGNDPTPGTGKWTVASGQTGVTFSDDTDPHAVVSGLQPGQVYKFTWTITAAPTCPTTQSTVTITNNAEAVGGTTSGAATVCAPINNGTITLTGYTGTILRWESSTDNGATWAPVANTTATLNYTNLIQTTQYRAVINGGSCGNEFSMATIITVNQPPVTANAGTDMVLCNVTSTTLQGNNPAPFTGEWTQVAGPAATIVDPADPQSEVTGLAPGNTYTFRWTIKGVTPCGDSPDDVVVTDKPDVIANFTPSQTQACGPTQITFTNNSAPVFAGTVYEWNFGDGSPVSNEINPTHTFQPGTDGKDITYSVTLTITGNCVVRQPATVNITVSPAKPDARINPSEVRSCGVLNLTVANLSPGTNDTYTYYLIDENNNLVTTPITKTNDDKSDAVFPQINPTHIATWRLYMEAKDKCGNINRSPEFQIPVSPSNIVSNMQIKDNPSYVCLGSPVFFRNLSAGGDVFKYTIYDENQVPITSFSGGLTELPYTFTNVGKYFVSITAGNAGCGDAPSSALIPIQVIPLPQPQFTFTVDADNKVKFVNITPDAGSTPAASLNYEWDFGDGTAIETSFTPNDHVYDYTNSPYTVKLTARNPGTLCRGEVSHTIEIKFTGELFLPNAFQPASTKTELRTFIAKGQKLKEWHMQVFNKWGQLLWQTDKLGSNGEPVEGWDGTFKGVQQPQGAYIWQASGTFQNGAQWKGMSYNGSLPKRSGVINLIR